MTAKPKLFCEIQREGLPPSTVAIYTLPARIGRHDKSNVFIDDEGVSRVHAVIEEVSGEFFVTDLGSGRGTSVNGVKITRQAVVHGDVIEIGSSKLVIKTKKDQPVAGAPQIPDELVYARRFLSRPAKTDGSVQVAMLFRDYVLADETFSPDQTVMLGPGDDAQFKVDESLAGPKGFVLLAGGKDPQLHIRHGMGAEVYIDTERFTEADLFGPSPSPRLRKVGPDTVALPLTTGTRARVVIGDLMFFIHRTTRPAVVGLKPMLVDKVAGYYGTSLLLHAILLALIFLIPDDVRRLSADRFDLSNRFVDLLLQDELEEEEDLPDWLEEDEDDEQEQDEDELAAGDEGAAGEETAEDEDEGSMAIEETRPVDEVELAAAVERVQDRGVLQALNQAPTSIFGGQATGLDDVMAVGMVTDGPAGAAYGSHGLGRYGGGLSQGGTGARVGFDVGAFEMGRRDQASVAAARDLAQNVQREVRQVAVLPQDPTIAGGLDAEIIRRVIRERRREVQACYEAELQRNPDLSGRVVFNFVITPDGSVASATVKESSLNNSDVESCIANRMRRWRFPEPRGGGLVRVDYPFQFSH